ncbi:MAG TPA: Pvc16 family protein [Candidatus Binatia bacterium]|nr:Pvc16 family protein [Candidatus Binatia bacterium]
MIRDLDETLQALLDQPGLPDELAAAEIIFDRPTEPFAPKQTSLDLFLYEIREHAELRNNEPVVRREGHEAVVEPPPLRVACSYVVTAWPVNGADPPLQEHRLLSQALAVLARTPVIPARFLQGDLVGQEPPLPMVTAQPDGLKNAAEFWSAIGGRLRAAFTTTVTISLPLGAGVRGPIVTSKQTRFDPNLGRADEDLFQIGGRVADAAGDPIEGAVVAVVDAGLRTQTGADGRYQFTRIPAGARTLRVAAVGFQVQVQAVVVPTPRPEDYDIVLARL